MSQTSDQIELREDDITKHYAMALAMLQGFDHAPRIGKAAIEQAVEKSSGIGTRRRFRSNTPGLFIWWRLSKLGARGEVQ